MESGACGLYLAKIQFLSVGCDTRPNRRTARPRPHSRAIERIILPVVLAANWQRGSEGRMREIRLKFDEGDTEWF